MSTAPSRAPRDGRSRRLRRLGVLVTGGVLGAAALPALPAMSATPDSTTSNDSATSTASTAPAPPAADEPFELLVFSKTEGFRHDSIEAGVETLTELGEEHGFAVTATEDSAEFTAENLARFHAVAFLNTTGDVLDEAQEDAFEGYIQGGGGYVGIHAAADTEYDWPWYEGLVGAWFDSHPEVQGAVVDVEDHAHPATSHLPTAWERTDEWYNFSTNPRPDTRVLASLDESSYEGGNMEGDHPIAWCHEYDGGRSFYTGGGHTIESFAEPEFRQHLLGGVRWAAGAAQADCRPETGYTAIFDGTSTEGWTQAGPGEFTLDEDGSLTSVGGMGLLWYEAEEFEAYSLKLDWRQHGDDNSGVFVGFPPTDDPWEAVDFGYEIQIDDTDEPDRTTGAIYGFQGADLEARDAALNPAGEWNTFEIRVEEERLRVWLNGTLINDFTNTDEARTLTHGHIGLQNHGDEDTVSFRNVRVAELTPEAG